LWAAALVLSVAVPLGAQNNGLPSQQQSAVLMTLIADRGEECALLRPWQAESLRVQNRDLILRFDDAAREAVERDIEARRPAMGCDDGLLVAWTAGAGPNFEQEYLPELLGAYRAFAVQSSPPEIFLTLVGREDHTEAIGRIDAKLAEMEAAGVRPPSGMTWPQLLERQATAAGEISAAIAGSPTTERFTREQAEGLVGDVVTVVELWMADEG
jgi:hypothetical protein